MCESTSLSHTTASDILRLLYLQTYVTLSLEDIASSAQLSSAQAAEMKAKLYQYMVSSEFKFQVLDMIAQSQIFARINQADGMVSFLEDPEEVYFISHVCA